MHYNLETERFILDVPTKCPKCGSELEVDTRYGEDDNFITFLVCSNNDCDYKLDASEEFDKASKAFRIAGDEEYAE